MGAGIAGASVAFHLAKKNQKVILIDRDDPGRATSVAAGIICPWVSRRRNQAWYSLASKSAAFYPQLIAELDSLGIRETGYKQTGTLVVRDKRKRLQNLFHFVSERRQSTPEIGEVNLLTEKEMIEKFPFIRDTKSAFFVSGGARVQGEKIRQALLTAARMKGMKFIQGEAVFSNNRLAVNGEVIPSDKIVLTNGAWFSELVEHLGLKGLIKPQKAQITTLKAERNTDDWPVVMPVGTHYVVPFDNGEIVAGTTHEDDAGFDGRVTPKGLHQIFSDMWDLAPALTETELVKTKVGFRPVAPDFLPVFGELPGFRGIYAANGLGSSGLTTGPFIGNQLAKLVIGEPLDVALQEYPISSIID